jgi:hypothetical protein
MPIMKALVYQQAGAAVPTETYGKHVWPGVLDEYQPTYGVLVQSLRDTYKRMTIDYARFGENWDGITVPVTFQSNQLGGGMFSYILSQPITPYSVNNSLLTAFLLMNAKIGRLTSYSYANYDIFTKATRTLHAYDELFINRTGYFSVPEWGINQYDGDNPTTSYQPTDPGTAEGLGGRLGADWYPTDYHQEKWYGISAAPNDFADELLLRPPTIEPWEWEQQDETGVVTRCPSVELNSVEFQLTVNRYLWNRLGAVQGGKHYIWVNIQLQTMSGLSSNSTVFIDLSSYASAILGSAGQADLHFKLDTRNLKLWDGRRYVEDPKYQAELVSAPTLTLLVFDADPARYFVDTGQRFFQIAESSVIKEFEQANLLKIINDRQAQQNFFTTHLLDAEYIGMNAKMDEAYLADYNTRIEAYQAWIEAQSAWSTAKTIQVIFSCAMIVGSIVELYFPSTQATGAAGLVFGLDQVQSVFTGRSIFSFLALPLAIPIMAGIYAAQGRPWTPEQTKEATLSFNIWAPFTQKTTAEWAFLNNIWGSFLCLGIIEGFTKLGATAFRPSITQLEQFQVARKLGFLSNKQYALAQYEAISATPGLEHLTEAIRKTARTWSGLLGNAKAILEATESWLRDLGAWEGPSLMYRIFHAVKSFAMGLVFPAEWLQGFSVALTGSVLTQSFPLFSNKLVSWLLNWGVMTFVFPFFKEQSTWGMIQAFIAAAQGDWSHFTPFLSTLRQTYQFLYQIGRSGPVILVL